MEFQSQFIQIGDLTIRYYGLIIVLALIAGTFVALNLAKRTGRDPEHVYGALTWAIIPGIIFARLWFVVFPPVTSVNTIELEEFTYNVPVAALVTEAGEIAPEFDLGLEFANIEDGSALADAGVEADDNILSITPPGAENPVGVVDETSLLAALAELDSDAEITLTVERGVPKDRNWYLSNFFDLDGGAIAIWSGGLSIFGALLGGGLGAYIYLRKNNLPIPAWLDIAAVALPLGQFIGRWANYVNQELFGDLVDSTFIFALRIPEEIGLQALRAANDLAPGASLSEAGVSTLNNTVVSGGEFFLTFHPLFLYEGLWSLAAFFVLLWLYNTRRDFFRPGDFLLIYIAQYSFIRFMLEFLRLEVTLVNGVNVSQVVTGIAFVVAVALLLVRLSGRRSDERTYDEIAPPVWPEEDEAKAGGDKPRKRQRDTAEQTS
jgi:phosphatidylglycerol---prolipoprotein diacylglyceryl transferase